MKVGVLALQGGVVEHVHMLKEAAKKLGIDVEVVEVRKKEHLDGLRAIVLPGGESTAMYRLGKRLGIAEPLKDLLLEGVPALGTCAGAALVAKKVIDAQSNKEYTPLLGVMDVEVIRNYFGRQRESFEADLEISGIGEFRGIFIRAPAIRPLSNSVEILATFKGVGVMAKQGSLMITSFHPELTSNTKIHEKLLQMAL
ncbi:glutamine amidotransferase [Ignicoccus pacificus DSM 13166]|uniref:Pyridoxal 5'-phosphate synthase subunit PdxT n=1 Tax=Ignicoccus pacificus DSM 13166 TaxID=940294 RepID=A0A977K9R6_9CREN|nr:glutamine amidotransferase [Ignicoccus pacificus DSM 13166]